VTSWWENGAYPAVKLRYSNPPVIDPYADYQVAHEFVFEPVSLNHLRVEIWITADGYVAIGLETRERIAARLRVMAWRRTPRYVFAAGHEPRTVGSECLWAFLDAVADGRVAIAARTVFYCLGKTKAVASASILKSLSESGCEKLSWIKVPEDLLWMRIVEFRRWTSV